MDMQHILERWLVFGTILLSLILALVFAAMQAGLF